MTKKLISIVIPAYSQPDYLSKSLASICRQSYRPIEVIVSDDASPSSLVSVIDKYLSEDDPNVQIKYFRHDKNLGYYWNLDFSLRQSIGDYLIMLDHDDWFIDDSYIADCLSELERNEECNLCISNTALELSPFPVLNIQYLNWHRLDGLVFMRDYLFGKLHPVRSSVVMRWDRLKNLGYFDFFIEKNAAKIMDIHPDESFVSLALLCSSGDILVSGRVSIVRGQPPESLSKRRDWYFSAGYKTFIQFYKLYKFFIQNKSNVGAQTMISNIIISYPVPGVRFKILSYLNFEKSAIFLMVISASLFRFKWVLLLPYRLALKIEYLTKKAFLLILYKILASKL
jgi:glycosyltransferase involved in cell wall biosynthesis